MPARLTDIDLVRFLNFSDFDYMSFVVAQLCLPILRRNLHVMYRATPFTRWYVSTSWAGKR